ncbi:MAG: MerR family transcriptional regulator [Burkholderiales bacterium]|nr:MerR family transcriptional regulator [Burkholderiales bacterium]
MSEQTMAMEVLDERVELTLVELCRASRADEQQVRVWVLEGVLEARGVSAEEWRFAGAAVRRARIARSLTQDLELNTPGVALALDLMDRIEALEARLRRAGLR